MQCYISQCFLKSGKFKTVCVLSRQITLFGNVQGKMQLIHVKKVDGGDEADTCITSIHN
jgi:hypothetical protein